MKTALIAYVPVIHAGYIKLFKKYPNVLFVLGADFLAEFPRIERDIRALSPEDAMRSVISLGIFSDVRVLDKKNLVHALADFDDCVLPDEDIMRTFAETYIVPSGKTVVFETMFLRWDGMLPSREIPPLPDKKISREEFDKTIMACAREQAEKSSDWWRRVGAVLVRDGKVLFERRNIHVPSERAREYEGDPRTFFDAGQHIDLTTALHAEAGIVSEAAKQGVSLEGTSIYVTTFPCPNCAKLIVASGIKKVFYNEGYSLLDAEKLFRENGVEIVQVEK